MKRGVAAIVYALITIVLWGTVAAVSKLLLKNITNFQLMFYVALFSTISLFILTLFNGKFKSSINLFLKNKSFLILLGILGLGIYQFFYFTSLANAPAAQVNVLNYLWPIFILIFSIFILNEKSSFSKWFGFLLGLLGAIIVITRGNFLSFESIYFYGYLLAIGAAISWGLFSVLSKLKKMDALESVFIFNLVGLVFMFCLMFLTNSSFKIPVNELFGTMYIGAIPTALAFMFWVKSLQLGKPSTIANLAHFTPFISLLFIFIILGEEILLSEIIGLVIIVSGIFIQFLGKKK
ncbi:MAG: DMT family transporter [Nanoarchaeota archaeon]|nr:DMT family transporter [Nanoarchaeota archaeon]